VCVFAATVNLAVALCKSFFRNKWRSYPTSIQHFILSNGEGFYPDFVIGVTGRNTTDGIILVDTKGQINEGKAVLEAASEHPDYGRAMLTFWQNEVTWKVVEHKAALGRNVIDIDFQPYRLVDF
jgi:hypothetical protein